MISSDFTLGFPKEGTYKSFLYWCWPTDGLLVSVADVDGICVRIRRKTWHPAAGVDACKGSLLEVIDLPTPVEPIMLCALIHHLVAKHGETTHGDQSSNSASNSTTDASGQTHESGADAQAAN